MEILFEPRINSRHSMHFGKSTTTRFSIRIITELILRRFRNVDSSPTIHTAFHTVSTVATRTAVLSVQLS